MTVRILAVACLSLSATVATAQTEMRTDIGFSDSASWTGGERTYQFRLSIEAGGAFRYSVSFLKEGRSVYDGWGAEFALGRRWDIAAGFAGALRFGAGIRMHSESSAHFREGLPGKFRDATWRTLQLNAPGVDEAMVYPFVSYGIQYDVLGPCFVDAQVRFSLHPTLTQWMWGPRDGPFHAEDRRSRTFIPGYHLGLGVRF